MPSVINLGHFSGGHFRDISNLRGTWTDFNLKERQQLYLKLRAGSPWDVLSGEKIQLLLLGIQVLFFT